MNYVILFTVLCLTSLCAQAYQSDNYAENLVGLTGIVKRDIILNSSDNNLKASIFKKGKMTNAIPRLNVTYCKVVSSESDQQPNIIKAGIIFNITRTETYFNPHAGTKLYTDQGFNFDCIAGFMTDSREWESDTETSLHHSGIRLNNIKFHFGDYIDF